MCDAPELCTRFLAIYRTFPDMVRKSTAHTMIMHMSV